MENNTTSCADRFTEDTIYGLVYFRCILSILSVFFALSMLAIIVLFKKYRFFTQRLILYLAISTLTYQFISAIDVTSFTAHSDKTALEYCKVIAFLTQVMIWWPAMATAVIVFDIFVRVVLEKSTERLEVLYVLTIFGTSLLISWIPLVFSAYGPSQYTCWIQIQTNSFDKGCVLFLTGLILRATLLLGPFYAIIIVIVILLTITIWYLYRAKKRYRGIHDPQAIRFRKRIEKEIKPIVYYPIVFLVTGLMSIAVVFNSGSSDSSEIKLIIFSVLLSILYRLQGLFVTIVFVLDPETRKKLNYKDMQAACRAFFEKEQVDTYEVRYDHSDSVTIQYEEFVK